MAQAHVRDFLQKEKRTTIRPRHKAAEAAKAKAAKTEKRRVLALERVAKAAEDAAASSKHVAAALADALEEYSKVKNNTLPAPSPHPDNDSVQLDA
ncbi:hypothetical protein Hte_008199 [Hypoxylon texense]